MFLKTTRRKRGDRTYTYLSLVESVRRNGKPGHTTLLRLGEVTELRDSGQLDRIIAALSRYAEADWADTAGLEADQAPAIGGLEAIWAYFRRLGLDEHFDAVGEAKGLGYGLATAVFVMVANRLVAPSSKRRIPEWLGADVVAPEGMEVPALDQLYRALDQVETAKEATETHLYQRLTDLTNLDLRLVCYDLTSTYFETPQGPTESFPSRALGYSRDQRPDRPQVVLGLLVTGDGIPIAHHVFPGNTADVATLPTVLEDLQDRFGVGRITMVADRGLISETNLDTLGEAGFDHVLATRLHRSPLARSAIAASSQPDTTWVPVPEVDSVACDLTIDGRRVVVVASPQRMRRDTARRLQLVARTETQLLALEDQVRQGRLTDPLKISARAQRILDRSGIARLFETEIAEGRFLYHYRHDALDYEEALAGHYLLTTSLTPQQASTAQVVTAYRSLVAVEARFRVLKDFLRLRPLYHWTETRVRGHIAICVYAAVIEALISADLHQADLRDPDLEDQHLTPARALRELGRIRQVDLHAADRHLQVVTRPNPLGAAILGALDVDTRHWTKAHIQ